MRCPQVLRRFGSLSCACSREELAAAASNAALRRHPLRLPIWQRSSGRQIQSACGAARHSQRHDAESVRKTSILEQGSAMALFAPDGGRQGIPTRNFSRGPKGPNWITCGRRSQARTTGRTRDRTRRQRLLQSAVRTQEAHRPPQGADFRVLNTLPLEQLSKYLERRRALRARAA